MLRLGKPHELYLGTSIIVTELCPAFYPIIAQWQDNRSRSTHCEGRAVARSLSGLTSRMSLIDDDLESIEGRKLDPKSVRQRGAPHKQAFRQRHRS